MTNLELSEATHPQMFMLMLRGITPNLGHIAMPSDEDIDDVLRPWRDMLIREGRLVGEWVLDYTTGLRIDALADEMVTPMWQPMEGEIAFRVYLVAADNAQQASELARSCPHLDSNGTVEVLRVGEALPVTH